MPKNRLVNHITKTIKHPQTILKGLKTINKTLIINEILKKFNHRMRRGNVHNANKNWTEDNNNQLMQKVL